MIEIEKPNIATINLSEDGRNGKFIIEPLERGYGITLGNSLRRVLLSSLSGVAVTNIKIDGVLHEMTTIQGVKEDVPEIVLNVKGITAKLHTDGPKTVIIDTTGACDITAGDIKQDADIEILNPDFHIATVENNVRFYMELTFDHGRGYVSQDKNKQLYNQNGQGMSAPIGTIFTDSIYTPVYNVNYTVENT
ncbi:MAG: DNA-directed RNA polymerase subunit alpha, partial [Clostridia bacterium]|nr:DNA-directed RNA polymerase subunit alpha [Clostridia bacterium]